MDSFNQKALAVATGFVLASGASSAAVLGATAVSSPQGELGGFPLVNIINQSSLSAGYVSGVTDFTTYTATTTGGGLTGAGFTAIESNGPQQFTFDLGSSQRIDAIGVWQSGSVGSITSFELIADTDSSFGNGVGPLILGPTILGPGATNAQVFAFAAAKTRYVHFNALTSAQPPDFYGLNEVVFNVTAVPEPTTLVLTGVGLAFMAGLTRRRFSTANLPTSRV